jgi:hypothetical protein
VGERCVIVCRDCSSADHPLPVPFRSYEERNLWAVGHTARTGHQRFFAMDGHPGPSEVAREIAIADTVDDWIGEGS